MNTNSNSYVMLFAVGVCVVISTLLALFANVLKPVQDAAAEFDRQKNVMMAAGLVERGDTRAREALEKLYLERVREEVIDTRSGQAVAGKTAKDVPAMNKAAAKDNADDQNRFRTVAIATGDDGKVAAIVLPVSGKGLWSTLYGYLALEADKDRVRGITFYKHGETPGLGGEVENPNWTAMWKGKTIHDGQGKLVSITVKKGKVDPADPAQKAHYVDGLSGATITSNSVSRFVKSDLEAFGPFLSH